MVLGATLASPRGDDRLGGAHVPEGEQHLADRAAMQRRAVADLEVDGDALRAFGAVDEHGRITFQHGIMDGLAGFLGDGAQAGKDAAGALVLADQMAGERQHLEGQTVVLGVCRLLHIAGLNQRHQHAVGGGAVGADASRDVGDGDRPALLADEVKHAQRLERGGADVGIEIAHQFEVQFVQYSYSEAKILRQVQISLTHFYF